MLPFLLFGQSYRLSTSNFYEGIAKGLIKDILVDDLGFVWMATDEGVVRFGGEQAVFYRDEIRRGFAKALVKKDDGQLLVVHDFGLTGIRSLQDTVIFESLLTGRLPEIDTALHYPKSAFEDYQGGLWIGEDQSVVRYENGQLIKYRFDQRVRSGNIFRNFSFAEDPWQNLWAMSFHGHLFFFDRVENRFVERTIPWEIEGVTGITSLGAGRLWVSAASGLFEVVLSEEREVEDYRRISGLTNLSCGLLVNDKVFYAGTKNEGLYQHRLDQPERGWERVPLPFDDIIALHYDENNGLWIGSNENLVLLTPVIFSSYHFSLSDLPVEALSMLSDTSLIVSAGLEVFHVHKDQKDWEVSASAIPDRSVPTALLHTGDTLWMGSFAGEVFIYDRNTEQLQMLPGVEASGSPVTDILQDYAGNIWIAGNESAGLIKVAKDGAIRYYQQSGLGACRVLYEPHPGAIFAGGTGAESYLFLYSTTADKFIDISASLPFRAGDDFAVEDLLLASDGDLLLATSDGLLRHTFHESLLEGRVKRIDLSKVPVDEPAKALARADEQAIWVSTNSGLIFYDNNAALLFDRSSGLPSNNLSYRGLLVDGEDRLWIATAKGLGLFQQDQEKQLRTPAPLFTSLKVNEDQRRIEADQLFDLPHDARLEVHFQSLSFPVENLKYQTRILEQDTSWSDFSSSNYSLLSGLQPGTYTFEVRAQQHGGYLWSAPSALSFEINRAWYQNWWAILLFVTASMLLIYGAARLYSWNLIQQKKRLEHIIRQRTEQVKQQKNEIIDQQKQIIQQNEQYRLLKEKQLKREIEHQNKQLTTYTLHLIQKNETLKELRQEIIKSIRASDNKTTYAEMKSFLALIDQSFRKDDEWENFKLYFENVYSGFFHDLKEQYPNITPMELRHCALMRLNLSIQESATILGISADSVKTARFRLRRKMNIDSQQELLEQIMSV